MQQLHLLLHNLYNKTLIYWFGEKMRTITTAVLKESVCKHEICELFCSTWLQRWYSDLQERNSFIDRDGRLTLWRCLAKMQQVKDAGDPCGPWKKKRRKKERQKIILTPRLYTYIYLRDYGLTSFGVCCNKYIIWPGLKVLNVLPVVCKIVGHCDSMEIKQLWSRRKIHL